MESSGTFALICQNISALDMNTAMKENCTRWFRPRELYSMDDMLRQGVFPHCRRKNKLACFLLSGGGESVSSCGRRKKLETLYFFPLGVIWTCRRTSSSVEYNFCALKDVPGGIPKSDLLGVTVAHITCSRTKIFGSMIIR